MFLSISTTTKLDLLYPQLGNIAENFKLMGEVSANEGLTVAGKILTKALEQVTAQKTLNLPLKETRALKQAGELLARMAAGPAPQVASLEETLKAEREALKTFGKELENLGISKDRAPDMRRYKAVEVAPLTSQLFASAKYPINTKAKL